VKSLSNIILIELVLKFSSTYHTFNNGSKNQNMTNKFILTILAPDFIKMYLSNEKTYVFLREESLLFQDDGFINSEDANPPYYQYGLVARVCHVSDIFV